MLTTQGRAVKRHVDPIPTGEFMPDLKSSYDSTSEFGTFYDAVPLYSTRGDVAFYLEEAERAGASSAVLEVGCGTGRLTLPLARAGHAVTGIDLSPAMLARARAKLDAEPPDVRARVTLLATDARRMTLPARPTFDLVIAPFRIMQHLVAIEDQLDVLTRVRERLRPGGRLAFDVFNPSYAMMTRDRSAEVEDTPEQALPDGRTLRRTVRVLTVHWVEQVSDLELIYYVRTGEHTERIVQEFEMRWFTPSELTHLVARAGFRLDASFGGFDRRPLDDTAPEIIVVASLATESRSGGHSPE
jgi:SAM-dependent methyltransferase